MYSIASDNLLLVFDHVALADLATIPAVCKEWCLLLSEPTARKRLARAMPFWSRSVWEKLPSTLPLRAAIANMEKRKWMGDNPSLVCKSVSSRPTNSDEDNGTGTYDIKYEPAVIMSSYRTYSPTVENGDWDGFASEVFDRSLDSLFGKKHWEASKHTCWYCNKKHADVRVLVGGEFLARYGWGATMTWATITGWAVSTIKDTYHWFSVCIFKDIVKGLANKR